MLSVLISLFFWFGGGGGGRGRGVMRRKTKREARKVLLLQLTEREGELELHNTTVRNLPFSPYGVQHCNKNPIYVFLFWHCAALCPDFHIHVSVSDLYHIYIFPGSVHILYLAAAK